MGVYCIWLRLYRPTVIEIVICTQAKVLQIYVRIIVYSYRARIYQQIIINSKYNSLV